jgi:membrane protein DedA with SNARE-associated domain/rhodanese-related sulfurtransferase
MIASLHLTYAGLLLAVFAEQLCLPIPSGVLLMVAGALSSQGEMQIGIIVVLGVGGCLVADGLWFWSGRRWGSRIIRLLCRFTANPRKSSEEAHEKFLRYGPPVLCVAKFFPGVNFVMPPLVAAEGVSPTGFLAFDAIGAFLWSGFYVGLGYVFRNQLDVAIGWVKHFGVFVGTAVGLSIALYALWRGLHLLRMIRRLRLRRITPRMLARKLKSSNKVAVLDLLDFEATESPSQEAIPGAFRVDPSRLRHSPHLVVPDDVDIVLYSSSGGDTIPARAAMGLKRIGVNNVWVLEGGLKAWRAQGFPLSESPELAEVAAARVGVKLSTT